MSDRMQRASRLFFFILYRVVQGLIFVGEKVKKVPVWITVIVQRASSRTIYLVKNLPYSKAKESARPIAIGLFKFIIFLLSYLIRGLVRLFILIVRLCISLITLPYRLLISLISVKLRYFVLGFIVCFIVLGVYQSYAIVKDLPRPSDIGKLNYPLSTHIYDRNGKLLYEVYHEQNRTPIRLRSLKPYIAQASIAIEDKDFYNHNGISIVSGVLRAVKDMVKTRTLQGGSTLTQQLVKSALLTPDRTVQRKIKEIVLALWTERLYSKDQILEMYLNQVPYGGSSYGIEEAAKTYYNKEAKDLSLDEAALLAGLPQAPTLYSPFTNPELAIERRNDVLDRMQQYGYISKKDHDKAVQAKLSITTLNTTIKAPHFVFYVKSELEKMYGTKQVEEGGMRVYTTLDLDVQEQAEKILKEELAKVTNLNVSNGAILVTKPGTGEILAMVGSENYFNAPYGAFNVTTALRQPGSSIKPLMYSVALEKGYTAATTIDDTPVTYPQLGGETYKPVNYDGRFHGKITLRQALANSYNIPAVRVLNTIGVSDFVNQAKEMGITTWNDPSRYGLSMTLGGVEVHMTDMATAFGVFANQGYRVNLQSVTKIEDYHGQTVFTAQTQKNRVMDAGVSYIISDILSDNFARLLAFGPHSALEIPGYKVAVKTGTTDEKKDNWTIGYTPDYLTAVWVGNNDNTPMNPYLSSGITGAAPIWNRVMKLVLSRSDASHAWFNQPETIVQKTCYFGRSEYFIKGTENFSSCNTPKSQPTKTTADAAPTPTSALQIPTSVPTSPVIADQNNKRGKKDDILYVPNNRHGD